MECHDFLIDHSGLAELRMEQRFADVLALAAFQGEKPWNVFADKVAPLGGDLKSQVAFGGKSIQAKVLTLGVGENSVNDGVGLDGRCMTNSPAAPK